MNTGVFTSRPTQIVQYGAWLRSYAELQASIADRPPIVALVGPAGSGKTSLITSYSDAQDASGLPVCVRQIWQAPAPEAAVDIVDNVDRDALREVPVLSALNRVTVLAMAPDVAAELCRNHPDVRVVTMHLMTGPDMRTFLNALRKRAGLRVDVLTFRALKAIEQRADGTPRNLELLFEGAWRAAREATSLRITAQHVEQAESNLRFPGRPWSKAEPPAIAENESDGYDPRPTPIGISTVLLAPTAGLLSAGQVIASSASTVHDDGSAATVTNQVVDPCPTEQTHPATDQPAAADTLPVASDSSQLQSAPTNTGSTHTETETLSPYDAKPAVEHSGHDPNQAQAASAWDVLTRPATETELRRGRSIRLRRRARTILVAGAGVLILGIASRAIARVDQSHLVALVGAALQRYAAVLTPGDAPPRVTMTRPVQPAVAVVNSADAPADAETSTSAGAVAKSGTIRELHETELAAPRAAEAAARPVGALAPEPPEDTAAPAGLLLAQAVPPPPAPSAAMPPGTPPAPPPTALPIVPRAVPPAGSADSPPAPASAAPPTGAPTVAVQGVSSQEIRFGMAAPFSGPAKQLGVQMRLGIETVFRAANDAGGVNGRKLTLSVADDGYDPARTADAMKQLVEKDRVFGFIGNVGTPTAEVALPLALSRQMLFYGAFTGANLLRGNPPDRDVFNFRASYAEETAAVVRYFVRTRRFKLDQIAVFAQQDGYGNAGFEGVTKAMRQLRSAKPAEANNDVFRLGYKRNTVDVDDAVTQLLQYQRKRAANPIRAVVMVSTYRAAAKFIEKTLDQVPGLIYSNVSFVGSSSLADELMILGPRFATGVIVTQVVPSIDSYAGVVLDYKTALAKYSPSEAPDFVSFEGYLSANVLIEALKRAGPALDTEKAVAALEGLKDLDLGLGTPVSFSRNEHQALHRVWGTKLDAKGKFAPLDLD